MRSFNTLMVAATEQPTDGWLPDAASMGAQTTDELFYALCWASVVLLALLITVTAFLAIKYRRRRTDGDATTGGPEQERGPALQIAWVVIPAVLLTAVFAWGFRGYLDQAVPPAGALVVNVSAERWVSEQKRGWSFTYPNHGVVAAQQLVVPAGKPVKLVMSSTDVPHGLWIPAFRISKVVMPDRYSVLWFEATEKGTFDALCSEHCGTHHAKMTTKVRVVDPTEFEQWAQSGGGVAIDGSKLFVAKACHACHSLTKERKGLPGPPLAGKYGAMETMADGSQVKVDAAYIRESLMKPKAKIVKGFAPVMPPFAGQLSDEQTKALIDYLKSL